MKPRVSLCTIVADGAATLPSAWSSVAALVDEWVVADTGSRDGTPELLTRLTPKLRLLQLDWGDDFAAARNATLAAAEGDWIFVLDADEQLEAGFRRLQALFATLPEGPVAYAVQSRGQLGTGSYFNPILRIYARDARLRYRGRVHEQPWLSDGSPLPVQPLPEVCLANQPPTAAKTAYYGRLLVAEIAAGTATPYQRYHAVCWRLEAPDPPLEALAVECRALLAAPGPPGMPGLSIAPDLVLGRLFEISFRLRRFEGLEALFSQLSATPQRAALFYDWALLRLASGDIPGAQDKLLRAMDPRLLPLQPGFAGARRIWETQYEAARLAEAWPTALQAAYRLADVSAGWNRRIQRLEALTGVQQSGWQPYLRQQIENRLARRQDVLLLLSQALCLNWERQLFELALRAYRRADQGLLPDLLAAWQQLLWAGEPVFEWPAGAATGLDAAGWPLLQMFLPPRLAPWVVGEIAAAGASHARLQATLSAWDGLVQHWRIGPTGFKPEQFEASVPISTYTRQPDSGREADWLLQVGPDSRPGPRVRAALATLLRCLPLAPLPLVAPRADFCRLLPGGRPLWREALPGQQLVLPWLGPT